MSGMRRVRHSEPSAAVHSGRPTSVSASSAFPPPLGQQTEGAGEGLNLSPRCKAPRLA